MAVVTLAELLEAGVHFGHQSRRWNPHGWENRGKRHDRHARRTGPAWHRGRLGNQHRRAFQRDDQRFLSEPRPSGRLNQPS